MNHFLQRAEELKESIPNVDYSTGFDLDKNIRMDYFEY